MADQQSYTHEQTRQMAREVAQYFDLTITSDETEYYQIYFGGKLIAKIEDEGISMNDLLEKYSSFESYPFAFSELLDVLAERGHRPTLYPPNFGLWPDDPKDLWCVELSIKPVQHCCDLNEYADTKELALLLATHKLVQELKKQTTPEANGN